MKEETYTCDLCREERDKPDLYAFFHQGETRGYFCIPYGNPSWPNCDRHICKACVAIIKEAKP
jgi:hypothetical protein